MPLPRQRRKKHTASDTRASRRNARKSDWIIAQIAERLERFAALLEEKRKHDIATGAYRPSLEDPPKQKAPGPATGGSSSSED